MTCPANRKYRYVWYAECPAFLPIPAYPHIQALLMNLGPGLAVDAVPGFFK